jgi:hypothetical protein
MKTAKVLRIGGCDRGEGCSRGGASIRMLMECERFLEPVDDLHSRLGAESEETGGGKGKEGVDYVVE